MFAFNPPEFLVKFVAGFGPVVVVSLLGAVVTLAALFLLVPNSALRATLQKLHLSLITTNEVRQLNLTTVITLKSLVK